MARLPDIYSKLRAYGAVAEVRRGLYRTIEWASEIMTSIMLMGVVVFTATVGGGSSVQLITADGQRLSF